MIVSIEAITYSLIYHDWYRTTHIIRGYLVTLTEYDLTGTSKGQPMIYSGALSNKRRLLPSTRLCWSWNTTAFSAWSFQEFAQISMTRSFPYYLDPSRLTYLITGACRFHEFTTDTDFSDCSIFDESKRYTTLTITFCKTRVFVNSTWWMSMTWRLHMMRAFAKIMYVLQPSSTLLNNSM